MPPMLSHGPTVEVRAHELVSKLEAYLKVAKLRVLSLDCFDNPLVAQHRDAG